MRSAMQVFGLLLIASLVACGAPPPGSGVASVELSPSTATIAVGETGTLMATATDSAGVPVAAAFTWMSSNPTSATVTNGQVTGLAPGVTTVTASAGGVTSDGAEVIVVGATDPSSYQLISEALRAGELDEETALSYKVFATFGDERLPDEYLGDDEGRDGTLLMNELTARFSGLSAGTQATLAPFLLPPSQPGSWFATSAVGAVAGQQVEWGTIVTTNDEVKVWYQMSRAADAARAGKIAEELDRHVWSRLTGLMREPLPDCGAACPEGGGDTRVDVYLVDVSRSSVSGASPTGASSAYMLLEPDAGFDTLAHELMHVIQFAYAVAPGDDYDWLFESTAEWAVDYVYPTSNMDPDFPQQQPEQASASWFLSRPEVPLEMVDDTHEYGAYILPFYLAGSGQSGATLVKAIWERATMPDSLAAVDSALTGRGGLTEVWPRFALRNWNQEPVTDYLDWDDLGVQASLSFHVTVGAPGKDELDTDVEHLAAFYYLLEFTSDSVQSVVIDNPYGAGSDARARVQAIAKIGGVWRAPEDWSRLERKRYCRNQPAEHIEELVIIVSNGAWADRAHVLSGEKLVVDSRATGCTCDAIAEVEEWSGTAGFSYQTVADDGVHRLELSVGAAVSATIDASIYGGTGALTGTAGIERELSTYDTGGALHFASSIVGSGDPVPAPFMDDESLFVLVIDPQRCQYTVGVRAYVEAIATDIVGETTTVVARAGSFGTAWRPIPDDLNLMGGGSFQAHSSSHIEAQPELVDAFLLDDFYVNTIMGEDDMGSATVSWSLVGQR